MAVPHLSIVIPSSRDTTALELTLAATLEHQPDDCEVIVVNDGSYGDPYELSGEVRFVDVAATASPVELINAGMLAARAPVVHLLQCGVEVKTGWTSAAVRHFDDPQVGSVAPELLISDATAIRGVGCRWGGRRVLLTGAARRTERNLLGPTIWGGFYRRSAVDSVGGWDPRIGHQWADLDLALSLRQVGFSSVSEPDSRIRMPVAPASDESGFRFGCVSERLFWKHQVASWPIALLGHTLGVAVSLSTRLAQPNRLVAEVTGRCVGLLDFFAAVQHRRQLKQVTPPVMALPFAHPTTGPDATVRRAA